MRFRNWKNNPKALGLEDPGRFKGRGWKRKRATQESQAMHKELQAALGQAFDSKNDLEHVRIKELLMRQGQLEQQIGRRQALRSQIIDRRARELIDGEQTKWTEELQ